MTPLPSYSARTQPPTSLLARLVRTAHDPADSRAGADPDPRRHEAAPVARAAGSTIPTEAMGRVIGLLRRLAGGEPSGEAVMEEARQVLSLLRIPPPPAADLRRARLNVVA